MEDKDYYNVPAISNSGMSSINPDEGGTPKRYKKFVIDRDREEEDTPSLQNGKLIHLYVEDPTTFVISDTPRPTEKLAKWIEETYAQLPKFGDSMVSKDNPLLRLTALSLRDKFCNTKDKDKLWAIFCKELDYLESLMVPDGKICMTPAQKATVEACVESLHNNQLANHLLFKEMDQFGSVVHNELPIYWKESIWDGGTVTAQLPCKGLLDRVRIDPTNKHAELIDLKTTGKSIGKFKDSFEYYRYYRQMAWYKDALKIHIGREYGSIREWTIDIYIVAVETGGLNECKVQKVNPQYIEKGRAEYTDLVNRIATATSLNDWTTSQEERQHGYIDLKP